MKKLLYILFLLITIDVFSHCDPKYTTYAFVNVNGYDNAIPVISHSKYDLRTWKRGMEEGISPTKGERFARKYIPELLKIQKNILERRNKERYKVVKLQGAETRYGNGWFKANFGCEEIAMNKVIRKFQPWRFDSGNRSDAVSYFWMDKAGKDLKGANININNIWEELHLAPYRLNVFQGFMATEDRYEIYPASYYNRLKKEEEERLKLEKEELKRKEAEEKRKRDFRKYMSADGTKSFVGKIRGIDTFRRRVKFEEENTKNIFIISVDNIFEDDVDYIREWYKKSLRNI